MSETTEAATREQAALAFLRRHGMQVHQLSAGQREAFRIALPGREALLPAVADPSLQALLVELAGGGTPALEAPAQTAPDTHGG